MSELKELHHLTEMSPREAMDLYIGPNIPVKGGWGYNLEDATIIVKDDPCVNPKIPFDGTGYEQIFIERRIYMELIAFPPEEGKYSGIQWARKWQKLVHHDGKPYDNIMEKVTAYPQKTWIALKEEWEGPHGIADPNFDQEEHLAQRDAAQVSWEREFWFDITSFFGIGMDGPASG
jgi:hypothetical protein